VISQAKSDFPSQTSAINSSLDGLTSAIKGLPANPSASQIAGVAASASSMVSSVKSFYDATSSKCR
jgi:flagellar hook-associated protein FlgK